MGDTRYAGDDFYCDQVLSGIIAVDVVMETPDVLAYHHTQPYWPTHIVVIPKRHIPSLVDLGEEGEETLMQMISVVRTVASDLLATHGACRVVTNLGAYQDSKHLHFHVSAGDPLARAPARPTESTGD